LAWAVDATEIAEIATHHPYDVSGGEQQRAALAMALLAEPKILFMDEPTKGMDAFYKRKFARILNKLREQGLTVVMVSHDVEFCAAHATRCALFFDGGVVTQDTPYRFFSGNSFYTTAANRMSRDLLPGVVTTEDLIGALSTASASDESGVS
jgi:energy-coupling factor transport system ATP-binding protein